jgi:hypothetical protein
VKESRRAALDRAPATDMRYILGEAVSFCTPGGHPVFLDLKHDRYLCLAPDAEESFRRLCSGDVLSTADRASLGELASTGLLVHSADSLGPVPCRQSAPERSAFETDRRPRTRNILHALWRIAGAEARSRFFSLSSSLAAVRSRKLACDFESAADEQLLEIAAAFRSSSLMASPLDRCLPRALATAHMMIDHGLCPEVVIGVRLQPFSAHCWVEHGPVLVNETLDRVRPYTPILAV